LFGFYLNKKYEIKIILQILTNEEHNHDKIYIKYKIGKKYLYSTKVLSRESIKFSKNYINNIIKEVKENNSLISNNIEIVENTKPTFISIKELSNLIKNNKVLFETGAGISYKVIPSLNKIRNIIRTKYNTQTILQNPNNLIIKLEKWFQKIINSKPTSGHRFLQKICRLTDSSIITGNFDVLHEKSGIIPIKVHKYKNYNKDLKLNKKYIKILIVIGVNVDFMEQIETFRKNGTKIIIFALNKSSIPDYVKEDDCIIIGDLHKNLKMLYEYLQ
jgi:hypothetical protein